MKNRTALEKQILFFVLIFIGAIFASLFSFLPYLAEGLTFSDISEHPEKMKESSAFTLRLSLFLNHLFFFLIPSFVYGIIFFRKDILKGFDLQKAPHHIHLLLSLAFFICCYPLIIFLHHINTLIPLTEWMHSNEDNVAEILNKIIISDSYFILFINILLIALMPAIGEELVFRGITQKNLGKIFKNGHIAVWVSAVLFSLIHLQFEGFLARMGLGAAIGYTYYYTKNFWIPIILHFFNNLIPLITLAIFRTDLTEMNTEDKGFSFVSLLLPLIGIPIIYYLFKKNNGERNIS